MEQKQRFGGLDRFKFIAAFLVVAIHTSPLSSFSANADFLLTRVLARTAVPFFLMVTGYFLLPQYLFEKSMDRRPLLRFLKKTVLLYGIAILLYLPVNIYAGHFQGAGIGELIRKVLFDGTFYHLWYLPAVLLGVPLVCWAGSRLPFRILGGSCLLLYLIGLFGDSYYGFIANSPIASFYDVLFHVFSYTRNGLFYVPIFLVMGTKLKVIHWREKKVLLILGASGSLFLMVLEGLFLHKLGVQRHDSMYFLLIPSMFFLFQLALAWDNFTVKQMERMRKQLEKKLDKLNDQSRKDDVVTFEQLGVDSLMVDEAHAFKNLAVLSKMRNVAGISQTESQRASDLYMKCRYLDEITGSRGVVFATGTPISNSMAELYTMQRYLQRETLEQHGLSSFDAWASTFGETVTAVELAPEGTGYRTKTRFSKFYNLPELMSMFKQVADVQTADMLNLPVPKLVGGKPINVALPPSPQQKQMVADLADRAEEIRAGNVDPTEDNMLKVTNDGRKLALDQRLIDPNLPENPNDKVHACAENVYRIWNDTKEKRLTQLVFCDLSTPKPDDFNVYDDLRNLLISMGIPENEVQFIHSANTEVKKAELFAKVRSGDVRVLMGSTGKMGAGTNVQRLLVATHTCTDFNCRADSDTHRYAGTYRHTRADTFGNTCRYPRADSCPYAGTHGSADGRTCPGAGQYDLWCCAL